MGIPFAVHAHTNTLFSYIEDLLDIVWLVHVVTVDMNSIVQPFITGLDAKTSVCSLKENLALNGEQGVFLERSDYT